MAGVFSQCSTTLLSWDTAIETGLASLKSGDFQRAISYFQIAYEKSTDDFDRSISLSYEGWALSADGNYTSAITVLQSAIDITTNAVNVSGLLFVLYLAGEYDMIREDIGYIYGVPNDFSIELADAEITKTDIADLLFISLAANQSQEVFANLKTTLFGYYTESLVEEMEAFFF
jgi:tetratricopeptide (TPR) repeat protein